MSGAEILFTTFALTTCLGAIAVVVSQNVVRMAFWLMVSLGSVAGLFFLLRADFVAATQLLIYVGGTVVLLVFGVMLTASGRFVKIRTSPADGFLGAGIGSLFLAMVMATVAAVNWKAIRVKLDPQYAAIVAVADTEEAFAKADSDGDGKLSKAEVPPAYRLELAPVFNGANAGGFTREELLATLAADDGFNQNNEGNTARPLGLAFLGVRPDRDLGKDADAKLSVGYLLPFEIISVHLLVVLIGAAYLARAKKRVDREED